jgi:hypothetical protein
MMGAETDGALCIFAASETSAHSPAPPSILDGSALTSASVTQI